jgi:hypothetical protein
LFATAAAAGAFFTDFLAFAATFFTSVAAAAGACAAAAAAGAAAGAAGACAKEEAALNAAIANARINFFIIEINLKMVKMMLTDC